MALDALTISPFLVIDDKLVEVFNGDKVCEIVKDLSIVFVSSRKAPPKDVHISNFAFGMQMHMAGCTCGDPLQLMKIIHHA